MHRQPQGTKRTTRKRPKPHPKEKSPSLKNNQLTGGRSGPTVKGAQWREPRTSQNPQLQRGPPGKRAPAAAGRRAEPPTEAQTPAGRKRVVYQRQSQNPSKGRGGNTEP